MKSSPVKVRLYGESFKIHALNLNKNNLNNFMAVSKKLNEPLEEALLDIHFYKKLNINGFNSIVNLIQFSYGGLINNRKSKIEIWKGRRCLQKLKLEDLFNSNTLFPLFNVNKRNVKLELKNNIFLIEKEIGLVGEFIIQDENFNINYLRFNVSNIQYLTENHSLLLSLSYKEKKIKVAKSDVLVISRYCVNLLKQN